MSAAVEYNFDVASMLEPSPDCVDSITGTKVSVLVSMFPCHNDCASEANVCIGEVSAKRELNCMLNCVDQWDSVDFGRFTSQIDTLKHAGCHSKIVAVVDAAIFHAAIDRIGRCGASIARSTPTVAIVG